jgi:hypothetical protein
MDQTTAGLRLAGDYSSGASPLVDIGYYSSATVGHATWVNRFRVLNNGNVGIGITNPARTLDINGTTNFRDATYFANGGVGYITWGTINSNNALNLQAASGYFLNFGTNATTGQMVIDTSGNVGIGTSAPAAKLEVNGNIKLSSTAGSTSTPSNIWLGNDFSNGSTRDKLKVYLYNSGIEQYGFTVGSSGDVQYHSNSYHDFYIANTLSLRINSSGNVGIGTTSPTQKLHVWNGGIKTTGFPSSGNPFTFLESNYNDFAVTVRFQNINPSNGLDADLGIQLMNTGGSIADVLRIKGATGNVGIGTTSPGAKLDVDGAVLGTSFAGRAYPYNSILGSGADASTGTVFAGSTSGYVSSIDVAGGGAANPNTIIIKTASAERMRITSGGNVGIASVAPAFALDVNGIVRATALIETSAKKYKTNIQNLEPQLNKVLQLQPVTFDWKEKKGERPSIGLIADDVINIYPEFVVKNKENEIEGIDYSKLTAVLIQSVKELKEIIDRQQEQINALLTK